MEGLTSDAASDSGKSAILRHQPRMRCFASAGYFVPLPSKHPFPVFKYRATLQWLKECKHAPDLHFCQTKLAAMEDFLRCHDQSYLEAIRNNTLPAFDRNRLGLPHHPRFLERSMLDTSGTIAAANAALEDGVAWNLGGGTHHAQRAGGAGFCITNDVAVAALHLRSKHPDLQILVLDTDAHQGDGTHALLQHQPGIFTCSIHVGKNYPSRKIPGDLDVALPRFAEGTDYLLALDQALDTIASRFQPQLVFWLSGVDVLEGDRFGQMNLSVQDIQERDHRICQWVKQQSACLVGTLAGGYPRDLDQLPKLHGASVLASLPLLAEKTSVTHTSITQYTPQAISRPDA
jgi:acetoin utilization deacetylase AcuC-like enzyme